MESNFFKFNNSQNSLNNSQNSFHNNSKTDVVLHDSFVLTLIIIVSLCIPLGVVYILIYHTTLVKGIKHYDSCTRQTTTSTALGRNKLQTNILLFKRI